MVVLIILLEMIPLVSNADPAGIVISEVMANPVSETNDEFIELCNNGTESIDLTGWQLTDGDAVDDIIAWDPSVHGDLGDVVTNSTTIPADAYAIILDNGYLNGGQPYSLPAGTIVMTVGNTTIGNGLTAGSDPVTLFNSSGNVVDTYGTPLDEADPLDRDDDGLDGIPFDPGNGISVEKKDLAAGDSEDNWAANADNYATPGTDNNPLVNYPPEMSEALAEPNEITLNGIETTTLQAHVTDPNGADDIASVNIDLSRVGGNPKQGMTGDGNDWYRYDFLPTEASAGSYALPVTATDNAGDTATAEISLELAKPVYLDTVVINELLPNPSGTETEAEFIELFNFGETPVNLTGWQLTDSSRDFELAITINAGEAIAFYNKDTSISLNNSGDEVQLLTPTTEERDRVSYNGSADEDTSYARRDDGSFAWTTTPTPNAANVFTGGTDDDETSSDSTQTGTTTSSDTTSEPELTDIAGVRKQNRNDEVKTKGVVTTIPGMLSPKYFYIQDSGAGIQIYASDGGFPELKLGNEIEVTGKLSEAQGEKRINVREGTIEVVGQQDIPSPATKKTGEIQEEVEGMLVTTSGPISRQSGKTFYLDDGSGETKISILKDTGIEKPKMTKGDPVTITGIVGETKSGYRVLPRTQEDFGGEVAGAVSEGGDKELPDAGPSLNFLWVIATVGSITGLVIRRIWLPTPL